MLNKIKTILKSSEFGRSIYEPIGYVYRKYYKDPQRLRKMRKYGFKNLCYILEIADKEGWNIIPIFGTLLGFVREGDFIKHDNDIDLAVAPGIDPKVLAKILVEKYGFEFDQALAYHGEVTEFSVKYNGLGVDFFFMKDFETELRVAVYSWNKEEAYTDARQNNVKWVKHPLISDYRLVNIRGISVKIPQNAEDLLYYEYGEDWRIPRKPGSAPKPGGQPGKILLDDYGYSVTYAELLSDKIPQ